MKLQEDEFPALKLLKESSFPARAFAARRLLFKLNGEEVQNGEIDAQFLFALDLLAFISEENNQDPLPQDVRQNSIRSCLDILKELAHSKKHPRSAFIVATCLICGPEVTNIAEGEQYLDMAEMLGMTNDSHVRSMRQMAETLKTVERWKNPSVSYSL